MRRESMNIRKKNQWQSVFKELIYIVSKEGKKKPHSNQIYEAEKYPPDFLTSQYFCEYILPTKPTHSKAKKKKWVKKVSF